MRFFLTGGAGFVGSNLTSLMLEEDNQIVCLDNLSTGLKKNIKQFQDNPNYTFIEGDVRDISILEEQIKACDSVFHMAAAVGVEYILNNPLTTISVNVKGTHNILELCSKYNKRVMIFSTSEVYGKNSKLPFNEEDDRIMGSTQKLRWAYASTKALDEFLAIAYNREKNLDVTIVRLFNTVGVGQVSDYGMVIPRFIKQAISNENITVYGDGSQTRCFCNVKDVVVALYNLMLNNQSKGEVYNIGTEERTTIKELAKKIIKLTHSSSQIQYIPFDQALGRDFEEMMHRVPDISKINKLINFTPNFKLKDTLQEIIDYNNSK